MVKEFLDHQKEVNNLRDNHPQFLRTYKSLKMNEARMFQRREEVYAELEALKNQIHVIDSRIGHLMSRVKKAKGV